MVLNTFCFLFIVCFVMLVSLCFLVSMENGNILYHCYLPLDCVNVHVIISCSGVLFMQIKNDLI